MNKAWHYLWQSLLNWTNKYWDKSVKLPQSSSSFTWRNANVLKGFKFPWKGLYTMKSWANYSGMSAAQRAANTPLIPGFNKACFNCAVDFIYYCLYPESNYCSSPLHDTSNICIFIVIKLTDFVMHYFLGIGIYLALSSLA